jgi:hypothetical protein
MAHVPCEPTKRDEDVIPSGPYCYASISPMDENGVMKLNGLCPFWRGPYCHYLNHTDDLLLTDQVKICGVKQDEDD